MTPKLFYEKRKGETAMQEDKKFTGREILYPIATVVVGGLLTSTLMEFLVRPALFWEFYAKKRQ